MHTLFPRRHMLALALGTALASAAPVLAQQQVIADGDEQTPAAGDYATTEPVVPGDPAGHVFYAINGGSIIPLGEVNLRTEGQGAAAARAEGAGSLIQLAGGSIITQGISAAGISAAGGGRVELSGTRIETHGRSSAGIAVANGAVVATGVSVVTHGSGAHGIQLNQGAVELRDSTIQVNGTSNAIHVQGGGTLRGERIRIEQNGGGHALWLATGADATLRDITIRGDAGGADGVLVAQGSTAVFDGLDIDLTHAQSGAGLSIGGSVEVRGGFVHARGDYASAVSFATGGGGSLLLEGVDLSGHFGIGMTEGSELTLRNSQLNSVSTGIDINQRDGVATISGSSITTQNGVGIQLIGDASLDVNGSRVTADGASSQAISVLWGTAQVTNSELRTLGLNGHALYAEGAAGRSPVVSASQTDILTEGAGAIGAIARLGGAVHLSDSSVRTTGVNSHGVLSGGRGEMTLTNTHVLTEGEGAWAAVINDNGRMGIDGGSLVSAQHGGIWVRSSRDPGLALSNGAVVSGGNGIALALDSAVAGRFDVALDGGAQLHGDIVITPEDEDAGLVPQSEVHVRLADGALWQGSSDLVQTLAL
ncbi:MAG TPA: autotransporter outer membrane beta-barrel domain-containing protein, partial [Stenotrophomonas sp.]|nr:autotransporter outer membrane beta-barrel domain-containing protein [Stenotrophomonas sp.]